MNTFLRTALLSSIQSIRAILGGMEILLQTREEKESGKIIVNEEQEYPNDDELSKLGSILGIKSENEIFREDGLDEKQN